MNYIEGTVVAKNENMKIGIVAARFNEFITSPLSILFFNNVLTFAGIV